MTTTFITGANKSLGLETARRLVEAGHTVVVGGPGGPSRPGPRPPQGAPGGPVQNYRRPPGAGPPPPVRGPPK
ncbi:hypothetical protein ACFXAN_25405, partial [Streptomyces misionensis]